MRHDERDSWHRSTFHAPRSVFEYWMHWFDIRAHYPAGSSVQDLVMLQRPAEGQEGDDGLE